MSALSREAPTSFGEALKVTRRILESNRDLVARGTIDAEAERLVEAAHRKATGKALSRAELFVRARDRYPDAAGQALLIMALSRADGRLLQHLTGYQAFLDHEYEVDRNVLIPRPETEILASIAMEEIRVSGRTSLGLEVGLGSGVLSIELLSRFPGLTMIASEISPEAEAVARRNLRAIVRDESRLRIVRPSRDFHVIEPFDAELAGAKADFIVSNPPYLARTGETEPDVAAHEPAVALYAPDADLLHFYRKIAEGAPRVLRGDGLVFLELAAERASDIEKLFSDSGWKTSVRPDLNGRPRVLIARSRGVR